MKDLGHEEDDKPHEDDGGGGPDEVEEPHGSKHWEVQPIGNGFEASPQEESGEEKENPCHDEDGEEGCEGLRGENVGRTRRPRRIEGEELRKEEEEKPSGKATAVPLELGTLCTPSDNTDNPPLVAKRL